MTDEKRKPIREYVAGCVECTAGFSAFRCDGVDHADVEIQRCDSCSTLPDDDSAALRLVRLAEWLAPDALESLAAAVATEIWRNPTEHASVKTNADGLTTIAIYSNAPEW